MDSLVEAMINNITDFMKTSTNSWNDCSYV